MANIFKMQKRSLRAFLHYIYYVYISLMIMMIMKFVSLCMSVCMYEEKRRQGHQILLLQMFIFFCFHDCMIPSASLYFPFSWYWYVLIVLLCKRSQRICTMIYAWKTFSQLVTLLCSCVRLYLPTQVLYAVQFFLSWRAFSHSFFIMHSHVVMQWHWAFFKK